MSSSTLRIVAVGIGLLLALGAGGCSLIGATPERPSSSAPTKPSPSEPLQHLTPPELIGRGENEIASLLGRATARRDEPPATVWEYRLSDCALDLFFYMDMETRQFRALAYDVSTTDGTKGDRALSLCLQQIMARRRD